MLHFSRKKSQCVPSRNAALLPSVSLSKSAYLFLPPKEHFHPMRLTRLKQHLGCRTGWVSDLPSTGTEAGPKALVELGLWRIMPHFGNFRARPGENRRMGRV